jgi:hypothetical protein
MRKYFLIAAGVMGIAVAAVFAQTAFVSIYSDYLGLHIGANATDKIGFHGVAPIAQKGIGITLTNGAAVAECVTKLQSIHNALVLSGLCKTNAP